MNVAASASGPAANMGVAALLTLERIAFAAALILFAAFLIFLLRRDAGS